jgi:hypothetical protein
MPWHIEADNAQCAGFAVVKDEDGEVEGCHRTRPQAEQQLAALYASEDDDENDDDEGIDDDDENLANEIGMRFATPNADAARQILAHIVRN